LLNSVKSQILGVKFKFVKRFSGKLYKLGFRKANAISGNLTLKA